MMAFAAFHAISWETLVLLLRRFWTSFLVSKHSSKQMHLPLNKIYTFVITKSYRVHLPKDLKWYISMKKSDQLNVKMYVPINGLHAWSSYESLSFFLLLPRIISVPGGSNHKEKELDLATCTE